MSKVLDIEEKEIKTLSKSDKEVYYSMRDHGFTHKGALDYLKIKKTPLNKFYNAYTGCICIPKSLFKGDIVKASLEFITNFCEKGGNKGYALEYSDTVCGLQVDDKYFEETFYCIREVEGF